MSDLSIEVDGLKESMKFLGRVDKALQKEAVAILKKHTLKIKAEAQGRMNSGPGVNRTYNMTKGAIMHRANTRYAAVGINRRSSKARNAQIFPAEFGTFNQSIPSGRGHRDSVKWPQGRLRRRTFPIWRGNQFVSRGKSGPGWIVQPVIRKRITGFDEAFAEDMEAVFVKAAKQSGIHYGG